MRYVVKRIPATARVRIRRFRAVLDPDGRREGAFDIFREVPELTDCGRCLDFAIAILFENELLTFLFENRGMYQKVIGLREA
ncbi:MAG: hypothetical protein H0X47_13885 [Nitrospirales bacterium]|nr:hypothetical protein [Nitrospirales bacterium]